MINMDEQIKERVLKIADTLGEGLRESVIYLIKNGGELLEQYLNYYLYLSIYDAATLFIGFVLLSVIVYHRVKLLHKKYKKTKDSDHKFISSMIKGVYFVISFMLLAGINHHMKKIIKIHVAPHVVILEKAQELIRNDNQN